MYTAADIRNVEFTKNMGGYKVAEVEAFVDNCADTVEALTSEKEELNKKLSILADKLVEYRRDEDSIRSALLSAQRMGDSIVREANEKAEKILAEARAQADNVVRDAKANIGTYQSELDRLKEEVAAFKTSILSLYKEHLTLLKSIPDFKVDNEEPAEKTPVSVPVAPVTVVAPVEEEDEDIKIAPAPVEEKPVATSKFSNLKFGEDYDLDEDEDED